MLRIPKHLLEEAGGGGSFLSGGGSGAGDPPASGSGNSGGGAGDPAGGAGGSPTGGSAAGSGGSFDWRSAIPADLKEEGSLKNISDLGGLIKSYVSAQKMVGADKVPIPGKLATDQDWKNFYNKIGMPTDQKEYKLDIGEEFKDTDKDYVSKFQEIAFKNNVLPKQAQEILKFQAESAKAMQAKALEARNTQIEKGLTDLKTEWGEATEQKRSYALQAAKEMGGDDFVSHLDKTGLGNDPVVLKFLSKVGETLYKEGSIPSDRGGGNPALTPAEALSKANSILMDKDHPYNQLGHPNHKAAIEEVQKLFQSAYPEKKK